MKPIVIMAACAFSSCLAFGDLSVGLMPADNSIPLVVAERDGLFQAEGVRVTLVPFSGQLERETALQTGAIDGTVSDLVNAIQAWSHGSGARVTSVTEGSFSLLAAPQSPLRTLRDWNALPGGPVRTGLLESSLVYYLTERMIAAGGGDTARIELVPIVQLPARLEMLLAGKIDAACLPEPLATLAVSRGARRLARSDDLGTTPGVLLFTKRALSERAAEIKAFYRAYDAAVRALARDPEAYRDAIVAGCGFPPAVAPLMKIPAFAPARLPSSTDLADVARWMRAKGLLTVVPSYGDVVAAGFVAPDARAP
jgi:NitT/TauT family transport system substrate-binding protein